MKIRLVLFMFFLVNVLYFHSQTYTPLLDNYNEWNLTTCYFGCLDDKYYTDGDTIVDGKSYKVLDGYHYISRTFLLREEIQERKVYMKLANYNSRPDEFLLYDFSISVGDSINIYNPISPFALDAGLYQLDSIKLLPLENGNNYRHFYLHALDTAIAGSQNAVWIEGVGSLSLINAPGGTPDVNDVGKISCFFKNDQLFYSQQDSTDECSTDYNVAINEKADLGIELNINYTDRNILVSYIGDKAVELMVYNMNGQLVFDKSIISDSVFDMSILNNGPFMFFFYNNDGVASKKVLIW